MCYPIAQNSRDNFAASVITPLSQLCLISVVVPTFRRPRLLRRCLYALAEQDLPAHSFEIIVVNDGNNLALRSLITRMQKKTAVNIRYRRTEGSCGPARARNIGWRCARGKIIAFTDDDCIPARSWLRAILNSVNDGLDAGWGRIVVPYRGTPCDNEREVRKLETVEFATANCFCSRLALKETGGFDERYSTAWREDSDLYFNLLSRSKCVQHIREATVIHPVRPASKWVCLAQQKKSMFNALLYKKFPTLFREKIESHPPLLSYLYATASVGLVAGVVLSHGLTLAGFFSLWLTVLFANTLRRFRGLKRTPEEFCVCLATSLVIPLQSIFWRLYGAVRFRVKYF